ncbi:MAG: cytochrome c biogenesis protein CcdA, partial [Candidatus Omnitrophica bacterium]|nr:cytochrome c biogenesis protein CcdA [Candidatus Omnitrophota bacterium]
MNLSGSNLDFLVAFVGGVAVSFTPCVYPLIPVVIGVVTARSFGSKIKGFIFSLVFVSGTAITYAVLGLIAALTGRIFGIVSAHPVSQFAVGIIVFIFGLYMFDLIKIPIPAFLQVNNNHHKKNGVLGILFMGLVSGLAIGPCTAPALGSILTLAGKRENLLYAAFLLMS